MEPFIDPLKKLSLLLLNMDLILGGGITSALFREPN